MTIKDCIVLYGPELEPWKCENFEVDEGKVAAVRRIEPCSKITDGATVVMPGLWNSHTHMGDSCAPDGATGLTLEQGFFRPHGYKYRMLAQQSEATLLAALTDSLKYMARSGTVGHIDFREQGPYGARLLRSASRATGVESIILGQFNGVPFDAAMLAANKDALPMEHLAELRELLTIADGFSESTMNDLTDTAWREIRDLTERMGKYRAIHCLENAGYRDVSIATTGRGDLIRAIEYYSPHIIIHLTVANDEEISLLAKYKVTAVLNPRANANLGLPIPPVAKLLKAGVNLLLGTDNGLLNSPNMLAEMDYTYKICKSQFGDSIEPKPLAILKMATSNIRNIFSGKHTGFLAENTEADFTVVDFNQSHLRRSQHLIASIVSRVTPDDILATYKSGVPIYRKNNKKH